jgi:outer membrane receptor for Fe3+-dicitrate
LLNAHTAFANLSYQVNKKLSISVEFTHQNYVMQQPGGLTDNQFKQNPNNLHAKETGLALIGIFHR